MALSISVWMQVYLCLCGSVFVSVNVFGSELIRIIILNTHLLRIQGSFLDYQASNLQVTLFRGCFKICLP